MQRRSPRFSPDPSLAAVGAAACVICVAAVSFHGVASTGRARSVNPWQTAVDGLIAVRAAADHSDCAPLARIEPFPLPRFEAGRYLVPLWAVSLRPGYALDHTYYVNAPVLYARPDHVPPPPATWWLYPGQAPLDPWVEYRLLDHLVVEDGPAGYLQLVALAEMGHQFCQGWHAGYHDQTLLLDPAAIDDIDVSFSTDRFRLLPTHVREAVRQVDLEPRFLFHGTTVFIQFHVFTKWGGLIRKTVEITRHPPYRAELYEEVTVVEYDCGVMF